MKNKNCNFKFSCKFVVYVQERSQTAAFQRGNVLLMRPRQAGKSTLLRRCNPQGHWIDLLKADEFRRYVTNPEYLRQELDAGDADADTQIVVDEIQKVAALPPNRIQGGTRIARPDDQLWIGAVNSNSHPSGH